MNIFRWSSTPTVPQWNGHDDVSLQLRLLAYVFARLRLYKLHGFLDSNGDLKYTDGVLTAGTIGDLEEDQTYAVAWFLQILLHDEYRVLVDFVKNKFRSFCIIGCESDSSSAPLLPALLDHKQRPVKEFRFVYLHTKDTTVELVASTLASSDIYCEHRVSMKTRYKYALDLILDVMGHLRGKVSLLPEKKSAIVQGYLRTMAFNVQLNRIYDETIKKQLMSSSTSSGTSASSHMTSTPVSTPPTSPRKPLAISTNNDLSPKKRPTLKSKPSILKFQLESLYRPQVPTPTSPIKMMSSSVLPHSIQSSPRAKSPTRPLSHLDASSGSSSDTPREGPVYDKCRKAVKARIDTERMHLKNVDYGH